VLGPEGRATYRQGKSMTRTDEGLPITTGFILSCARRCRRRPACGLATALLAAVVGPAQGRAAAPRPVVEHALVVTQVPLGCTPSAPNTPLGGTSSSGIGEGARLSLIQPDGTSRVLSAGFHSACDPSVSFDARRILFAGKRSAADRWNIFELTLDGLQVRQLTKDQGNCRSPCYQSRLFSLDSSEPWYQVTFVSDAAGTMNEDGSGAATHLYSCKLDGTAVCRLTFNLSSDADPFLMRDGRLLYAGWRRGSLDRGLQGRWGLFGVNLSGSECALLAEDTGSPIKRMPCVTSGGWVVFVEATPSSWDGTGMLAAVRWRRPMHSYQPLTRAADGLFHSPSPLPDGRVLVSRRPGDGPGNHAVYAFDPATGKRQVVFDAPDFHDLQAKCLQPEREPDGQTGMVHETDVLGKLYCLNAYASDVPGQPWVTAGTIRRVRVLEGLPLAVGDRGVYLPPVPSLPPARAGSTAYGLPPLAPRQVLGEFDLAADGSFHVQIPANTPLELQVLDADGVALRSCRWIWTKNHGNQGCIGCHEDPELTPENRFAQTLGEEPVVLAPPRTERRGVDFRRDVMPLVESKCVVCHGPDGSAPRLDGGLELILHGDGKAWFNRAYESLLALEDGAQGGDYPGRYVQPGSARRSPLIWHLLGRNLARPWDGSLKSKPAKPIPPGKTSPLTEQERRTFVEWIDLGAMWDSGVAHATASPATRPVREGKPE
jgi:hypothetical protein